MNIRKFLKENPEEAVIYYRGLILHETITFEKVLDNWIITILSRDLISQALIQAFVISNIGLSQKIKILNLILKNFFPRESYNLFRNVENDLREVIRFRNLMSHYHCHFSKSGKTFQIFDFQSFIKKSPVLEFTHEDYWDHIDYLTTVSEQLFNKLNNSQRKKLTKKEIESLLEHLFIANSEDDY